MKTKKNKGVKLLNAKVGKPNKEIGFVFNATNKKENVMNTETEESNEFDFSNISVGKKPPVKRDKPPTRFTPDEDGLLVAACKQRGQVADKEFLSALAKHLNIKFHDKKKQRTGDSLWWHIKREQGKGNTYFAGIEIPGGSPRESKGRSQVINSALKTPKVASVNTKVNILPPTTRTNNKTSGGKNNLEVIVRDPLTGATERFQTKKYENVEEMMFANT